jgi:type I restriction enzyme, S subunit
MERLAELEVPIPDPNQQQKFAQNVKRYERLRAQQREAPRQAEHFFQTLLHKAFQGELTGDESDKTKVPVEVMRQEVVAARPEP